MWFKKLGCLDMPMIGVGTYGVNEAALSAVLQCAIPLGAVYIDSAYRYENESFIGRIFERGEIKRDEVILGTKLAYSQQQSGDVHRAVDDSLRSLKTDYIDLYFIHSPKSNTYCADWDTLLRIREKGKIRELAVSNFGTGQLDELHRATGVYPVLNQVEIHPGCYPNEVIEFCRAHDITVQASCPLGRMSDKIVNNPDLTGLAHKYQKSIAQLSLRWLLQLDILSVPRTCNTEHMTENLDVFDFEIDDHDMDILSNAVVWG